MMATRHNYNSLLEPVSTKGRLLKGVIQEDSEFILGPSFWCRPDKNAEALSARGAATATNPSKSKAWMLD